MADSYSIAPIWFTDVIGSALMILLALMSVMYARRLQKTHPSNVIWTYLLWLSVALCGFALSRGVGHIAKRGLLAVGMEDTWAMLKPYSGSINSVAFMVVASITLFFQRVQRINTQVLQDKQALEAATNEVMRLNRGLESLVRERTEDLSRSEKKYRRIFEGSMDMIFVLDEEARFVDLNPAGIEVLGYGKPEDVLGIVSICRLFVVGEQCDQLMSDLERVGYVRDRECILQAADGSEKFFLLSATGRKDRNGKIIIYEGIAKDITSWVSMQRQLQQADRLASLGQISTGIAHEVNNPLGVILAYTQLLLRDYPPESQIHDDLRIIEKHARNCKSVVEDLLKFARGTRTNKTTTNVNQCLTEVLSLLAHQFELDNIALTTDLDEELPNINADDEKLKQVFMNLLMNAKQAISGQGRISVESKMGPERSTMLVSVSDNGSGIRPGHLDKIFDPFFTTKAVGEGTGLGLSVSYGIVRDHNGRIDVSSRLGVGSTFSIVLPLDDQNPVPERVANAQ